MNDPKQEDFLNRIRTPSIKNIIRGANKKPKILQENFFEKIFDLEMALRQRFSMPTLEELVHELSTAIEYYESNDDQKFRDYQMRLCVLLSKPEIIKQMDLEKQKQKSNSQIENMPDLTNIKYKKDQEKKQLKMKVNYISQLNTIANQDNQVKVILEEIHKNENPNDELFYRDLNRQANSFHTRLQERRSKKLPKIDEEDKTKIENTKESKFKNSSKEDHKNSKSNVEELEIKRENYEILFKNTLNHIKIDDKEINLSLLNQSKIDDIEKTSLAIDTSNKRECSNIENTNLNDEANDNCSLAHQNSNEKTNCLDEKSSPRSHKNADQTNQIDISNEKIKPFSMFSISEKYLQNVIIFLKKFQESKVLGPKHKQMFNDIKETIECFISDFNKYFYEHLFQKFIEQIQKITDEKYLKYIEISKNYHSQIKEMEFLINSASEEDDNNHKDSLQVILDALKEEQQHELDRIEDYYNKLINDAYSNFKNFGFKNNSGIQIIEEKFKLDTFNMMNDILNTKIK